MAKKAKADNTTDTVRKRRRAARKRKRVERRLKPSEHHVVPQSELTPEEHEFGKAMIEELTRPLSPWEEVLAKAPAILDRAAAEEKYGRLANRPVSIVDAVAPATVAPPPFVPAKDRIVTQAPQMKRDGDIPEGILKTDFAKLLAAKTGVSYKYVRNHLTEWGLWPISDIK